MSFLVHDGSTYLLEEVLEHTTDLEEQYRVQVQIRTETLEQREDQVLQLNDARGLGLSLLDVLFGCLFVDGQAKNRLED